MPYSLKKLKGFFEVYNIHAALSDAVQLIYKSEFESAARESFVAVENYLKKKSGLDSHGFDLATRALSFEIDKLASIIKNQFHAGCVYVELTGYKFAHGHTSKMFFEVNQAVNFRVIIGGNHIKTCRESFKTSRCERLVRIK